MLSMLETLISWKDCAESKLPFPPLDVAQAPASDPGLHLQPAASEERTPMVMSEREGLWTDQRLVPNIKGMGCSSRESVGEASLE